jgi:PHP domain-containing protein
VSFVGTVATELDRDVRSIDDLVEELRAGRCRAVDFRQRPGVAAG